MTPFHGKIIQFFQSLAWSSRLCVFHLAQRQVQSKDRVTMATLSKDSDIEIEVWKSDVDL